MSARVQATGAARQGRSSTANAGACASRAPVPTRAQRSRGITPKMRETFLEALAAGWSIEHAAQRAGRSRRRFYELREREEHFGEEWDGAIEAGCDVLEDALRIAASEGWDEETYDGQDVLIRRTRRRDPRLNERLLERRRPTQAAGTGPVTLVIATAFPGVRRADLELEAEKLPALEQGGEA